MLAGPLRAARDSGARQLPGDLGRRLVPVAADQHRNQDRRADGDRRARRDLPRAHAPTGEPAGRGRRPLGRPPRTLGGVATTDAVGRLGSRSAYVEPRRIRLSAGTVGHLVLERGSRHRRRRRLLAEAAGRAGGTRQPPGDLPRFHLVPAGRLDLTCRTGHLLTKRTRRHGRSRRPWRRLRTVRWSRCGAGKRTDADPASARSTVDSSMIKGRCTVDLDIPPFTCP